MPFGGLKTPDRAETRPTITVTVPPAPLQQTEQTAQSHAPPDVREPLSFRQRYWVWAALFLGDVAALELAVFLGALTRSSLSFWLGGALRKGQLETLALSVAVLPLAFFLVGLYPGYGLGVVERLRRRVYTLGLMFGLLILSGYLVTGTHTSRGVLLLVLLFSLVLLPLVEAAVRRILLACNSWGMPVAVLGAAQTGALVVRVLKQEPELGLMPVAVYDDDPHKWDKDLDGVPVIGPLSSAKKLSGKVKIALLAMPGLNSQRSAHLCARLPFPRVILIPNLIGLASTWVSSLDLGGVVGLEVKKNLFQRRNWMLKRALDYVIGVPLCVASLPLLGVFAIWIKLVSRGPVLYSQPRVGLGGKTIRVWKMRTMYPDADERLQACLAEDPGAAEHWEKYCKLKNDPRVLPGVGRLLRRTSLDELPQLWNVMKGEMSLVGPRPFPHYHLDRFRPEFRTLRRSVLPGMTGLWQVSARSDGDVNVQEVLDTYYIRNWSPWLDVYLLARTTGAVVLGRGAY